MTTQQIKGYTVLVPGTLEPVCALNTDVAQGTRQYIVFCDPDAKEQAEKLAQKYPEEQRFVEEVVIIKKRKLFNRHS